MPPWRASRGLVLGLLTVTLVAAESLAAPAHRDPSAQRPDAVLAQAAPPVGQDQPRFAAQGASGNKPGGTTVRTEGPPNQTGLIVVLLLLLLALLVTLTGALCKLREYGGAGAYYPWRMESGARGSRGWARVLRSLLPGGGSSQRGGLEGEDMKIVDEEDEGEEDEAGSEGEEDEEEEEEEEGGSKVRGEGDSLSDYSSLGGVDLRERAEAAATGDDGSLPSPSASPRGSQVLGGLHSLAGSAPWGEAGQDVTAL